MYNNKPSASRRFGVFVVNAIHWFCILKLLDRAFTTSAIIGPGETTISEACSYIFGGIPRLHNVSSPGLNTAEKPNFLRMFFGRTSTGSDGARRTFSAE